MLILIGFGLILEENEFDFDDAKDKDRFREDAASSAIGG